MTACGACSAFRSSMIALIWPLIRSKRRIQLAVFAAGHDVEAFDHLKGVFEGLVDLIVDIGQAKDLFALEFFVHVGQGGEQFGVGSQQFLEQGVPEPEQRIHLRRIAGLARAVPVPYIREQFSEILENGGHGIFLRLRFILRDGRWRGIDRDCVEIRGL